jgi:hypothetical protein
MNSSERKTLSMLIKQYTYIVDKNKTYLYKVEKRTFGELFCSVSQRVQMNFIFSDNIHILCLSLMWYKLYLLSSCIGSIWTVRLHWLHKVLLYTVTDQDIEFRISDSCWATVRNGNSISVDFTEDTIKNDDYDTCFCSF